MLELALREALSLGHNYIGTEHILLGLVRENDDLPGPFCESLEHVLLPSCEYGVEGDARSATSAEVVWS